MRTLKVLVVFVLVLVPSAVFANTTSSTDVVVNEEVLTTAPSKVCHPKKPVTCRNADLDVAALIAPQAEQTQLARVCYGPRSYFCRAESLESQETIQQLTQPAVESQEARVCYGPRSYFCRVDTLN